MRDYSKEKFLVTSALPYANGPIHFGHICGAYLPADIFVRYMKMNGADIIYVCGSDDHGVAITISAEAAGRSPQEHVRVNHELIVSIFKKMNIKFDIFSKTSTEIHHEISKQFFTRLNENGLMEQKETEQLFCKACDRFLADRYVTGTCPHCGYEGARGDECGGCGKWLEPLELKSPKCKVCGDDPQAKKTSNWYLKLKDREDWLRKWLDDMGSRAEVPWKKIVTSEIKGYLDRGLESRAITRDLKWGIPLPEPFTQEGKVLYVWFDAPIGYVSATRELRPNDWKECWTDPQRKLVHFIGKDNIPFHAMIFPIMLHGMDEGYNIPYFVAGNAFLNLEGRQFSKSEGWYVDPLEFFENYPVDSARYYLCAEMPEDSDSEFRWESYQTRHNSELVNIYANLINRTLKFVSTKLDGCVPAFSAQFGASLEELKNSGGEYSEIAAKILSAGENVAAHLDKFTFRAALAEVLSLARAGNKFFDDQAPWKSLESNRELCCHSIRICLELLKTLAAISYPFLPDTAERTWKMLGFGSLDISTIKWAEIGNVKFSDSEKLPEPEPLFNRIDAKQVAAEKNKLGDGKPVEKKKQPAAPPAFKKAINIDDFGKLDLRVAKILEAEPVQGSMKMLKLQVDLGIEKRQIVAGIAKFYKPEDLVGKLVIVVANLQPKKLMGLESQGMVLCAGDGESLNFLAPSATIGPGSKVS